jgi:hypothetical protein
MAGTPAAVCGFAPSLAALPVFGIRQPGTYLSHQNRKIVVCLFTQRFDLIYQIGGFAFFDGVAGEGHSFQ